MTPQERKVMELALEALEYIRNIETDVASQTKYGQAAEAIEEALAKPKQKPVAWRAPNWGHGDDEWVYRDFDDPVLIADGKPSPNNEALYTTPPQRKPLTHEQRFDLLTKFEPHKNKWEAPAILIDMVEAAHNIKGEA